MSDFTYRGCHIVDTWPIGAKYPGSYTRSESRRRVDGSQRWQVYLPSGRWVYAFTKREARAIVSAALS